MQETKTIKILPDGSVIALYDDDSQILKNLGSIQVERASNVKFDADKQKWYVVLNLPDGTTYRIDQDFEKRADAIQHEVSILNAMLAETKFEDLFMEAI